MIALDLDLDLDLDLIPPASPWRQVDKFDARAREIADRHYSRQSIGNAQFMAPGRTLILIAEMWTHAGDVRAVWGAIDNLDPAGARRFRCSIFRNETPWLSSTLIASATQLTLDRWRRRGWLESAPPLSTEVDPAKTRHKRDPGRCFVKAGWERWSIRRGLVVLLAPGERARTNLQGPVMR